MSLITGAGLDPARFFSAGTPIVQGSTFDLTIGKIFDSEGCEWTRPFELKPGQIVQVVSAQVFNLPTNVTGHATYKTTLTKVGIWALTVGIVDPGWNGPLTTTLLNFSQVSFPISIGMPFLRISLFEHGPVPANLIRTCPPLDQYFTGVQEKAMTVFAPTFMNHAKVVSAASEEVLEKIQKRALPWVATVASLFALLTLVLAIAQFVFAGWSRGSFGFDQDGVRKEISDLQANAVQLQSELSRERDSVAAAHAKIQELQNLNQRKMVTHKGR